MVLGEKLEYFESNVCPVFCCFSNQHCTHLGFSLEMVHQGDGQKTRGELVVHLKDATPEKGKLEARV